MALINLLPKDYLKRRQQKRANIICMLLFAAVMCGVGSATILSRRTLSRTGEVLSSVETEYERATALISQLENLEAQKAGMLKKAKDTSELLERVPRSYLLATITNALPEQASLLDLDLHSKRIIDPVPQSGGGSKKFAAKSAARQAQYMMEMDIKGLAATDVEVARFIASLAANDLNRSVDLVYSQEKTIQQRDKNNRIIAEQTMREFQVRIVLNSNIDVIDLIEDAPAEAGGEEVALFAGSRQ